MRFKGAFSLNDDQRRFVYWTDRNQSADFNFLYRVVSRHSSYLLYRLVEHSNWIKILNKTYFLSNSLTFWQKGWRLKTRKEPGIPVLSWNISVEPYWIFNEPRPTVIKTNGRALMDRKAYVSNEEKTKVVVMLIYQRSFIVCYWINGVTDITYADVFRSIPELMGGMRQWPSKTALLNANNIIYVSTMYL